MRAGPWSVFFDQKVCSCGFCLWFSQKTGHGIPPWFSCFVVILWYLNEVKALHYFFVNNLSSHINTSRQINSKIKSKTIHVVYEACPTYYIFELICQNRNYKCQKLFLACPLILTKSLKRIWYTLYKQGNLHWSNPHCLFQNDKGPPMSF